MKRITTERIALDLRDGLNAADPDALRKVITQIPTRRANDLESLESAVKGTARELHIRTQFRRGLEPQEVRTILNAFGDQYAIPKEVVDDILKSTQKTVIAGSEPSHQKKRFQRKTL